MKKLLCLLLALLPLSALAEGTQRTLPIRTTIDGQSVSYAVPVSSIDQRDPTDAEMRIEDMLANITGSTPAADPAGVRYLCESEHAPHETLGFRVHEVSRFSKYDGKTLLWTVDVRDYWVHGWQEVREGVLLWGYTDVSLDYYGWPVTAWMTLLSHEGEVCWSQALSPTLDWEITRTVLDNGDGTYTAFSRENSSPGTLCIRRIGSDGQLLSLVRTPMTELCSPEAAPPTYILKAQPTENGFLLLMSGGDQGRVIVLLDREGNPLRTLNFASASTNTPEQLLTVTDAHLSGGSLWLSGYLTLAPTGIGGGNLIRDEIADVLHDAYRRWQGLTVDIDSLNLHLSIGEKAVTSEYLTPRIRECYTAVLLRIDAETFAPQQAHTVASCLGGALTQADEGVAWDVQSLINSCYSPFTSAFTISGALQIFRYTFTEEGAFLGGGETEEFTTYLR